MVGSYSRAAALCFIAALLSAPGVAVARGASSGSPTEGVINAPAPGAALDDTRALERNSAGLAFQRGFELRYTHIQPGDGDIRDGLLLSYNIAELLTPALGFSIVRLPGKGLEGPDYLKVAFGLGLALGENAALGVSVSSFNSDQSPRYDQMVSWDLGFIHRPWSFLSWGLNIHNLNSPAFGTGQVVPRRYDAQVAVRPIGNYLTLGADFRYWEEKVAGVRRFDPAWFLGLSPFEGLRLAATVDSDLRALFTLSWDFEKVGIAAGQALTDNQDFDGFMGEIRLSTAAWPTAVKSGGGYVEIDIGGDLGYQSGGGLFSEPGGYVQTLMTLRRAARDPEVSGVILRMGDLDIGWARATELRRLIAELGDQGKETVVWTRGGGDREYYVASAAKRVVAHPGGTWMVNGLEASTTFLAGSLRKAGIQAQFVKVGDYKTAPNTFTEVEKTAPQREQDASLLTDLSEHLLNAITEARALDRGALMKLMDRGVLTMSAARDAGLVDDLRHYPDLRRHIARDRGIDDGWLNRLRKPERWSGYPRVGVIMVEGNIHGGESESEGLFSGASAGALTITRALQRMVRDSGVLAIVVRIDSPGGSSLASDDLWRTLALARAVKPVVVSFGDVAASGGYYMAASSPLIMAEETTITGSIGIFAGKFSLTEAMGTVGLTRETTRTHQRSDLMAWDRPWDEGELQAMQTVVDDGYNQFIDAVSEGRGMDPDAVKKLAGGRVYTGRQALEKDLVDLTGGLLDAIDQAKRLAGLSRRARVELDIEPSPGLLDRVSSAVSLPGLPARAQQNLQRLTRGLQPLFSPLAESLATGERMALMPYSLEID